MASMHFRKPLKDLDGDAPVVSRLTADVNFRLNSHKHMAEFEKKARISHRWIMKPDHPEILKRISFFQTLCSSLAKINHPNCKL